MAKLVFKHTASFKLPEIQVKPGLGQEISAKAQIAVSRGIDKAAIPIATSLKEALNKAMMSNAWGPFNPSEPYIGAAGNEKGRDQRRTLIETGALSNSLKIGPQFGSNELKIVGSYNSPYATFTHYGGWMRPWGNKNAALKYIVPRPWVTAVFQGTYGQQKFNPDPILSKEIGSAWRSTFG